MQYVRGVILTIGLMGISAVLAAGCSSKGVQAEEPQAPAASSSGDDKAGDDPVGKETQELRGSDPCGGNPR